MAIVPRRFFFATLVVTLVILWAVLAEVGVRKVLIIGWVITVGMLMIWGATIPGWINPQLATMCAIIAVATAVITLLGSGNLIQKIVPYCGDGVCAPGECNSGCEDCNAATCADGICQALIENCRSSDCSCSPGMTCAPLRATVDTLGCYEVTCGDGFCDAGESAFSCCLDCSCQNGYACQNNICLFQPPSITFTPYLLSDRLSATTLAANPSLTDVTGRTNPIVALEIRNAVSAAVGTNVRFAIPGFIEQSYFLGTLDVDEERPLLWYLEHTPQFLRVEQSVQPNITIVMSYQDLQGVQHSSTWTFPFSVLDRDIIDSYGNIAFMVTPNDIETAERTPQGIWDELGRRVEHASNVELQFPTETLASGRGSQRDIALLVASAFVHAGLRTALVESDYGVHVRVLTNNGWVMLDPTMINRRFEEATVLRQGFAVHEIEKVWEQRNATVLSLG